jgi:hypothetical protein
MQSDHPVSIPDISYEAQQVHYYGLPANLALATVTTLPAQVLGLEHRIGYVKEGKCQCAYYGDRRHAVGSLTNCLIPRLGCWWVCDILSQFEEWRLIVNHGMITRGQSVEKKTMALAASGFKDFLQASRADGSVPDPRNHKLIGSRHFFRSCTYKTPYSVAPILLYICRDTTW